MAKTLLPLNENVLDQACEACNYVTEFRGDFVLKNSHYNGVSIYFDFSWVCECGHQDYAVGEIDPAWWE